MSFYGWIGLIALNKQCVALIGSNLITFQLIVMNVPGFVSNLLKNLGHSCIFLASESVGVLSKKVNVRVHCYL